MLNFTFSSSIKSRLDSAEGGNFFFEPLQFHLESPDLLEQFGLAGLGVS